MTDTGSNMHALPFSRIIVTLGLWGFWSLVILQMRKRRLSEVRSNSPEVRGLEVVESGFDPVCLITNPMCIILPHSALRKVKSWFMGWSACWRWDKGWDRRTGYAPSRGGAPWGQAPKSEQENTRSETHKGQMGWFLSNLLKPREKGKVAYQPETGQETEGISGRKSDTGKGWGHGESTSPSKKRCDLRWEWWKMRLSEPNIASTAFPVIPVTPSKEKEIGKRSLERVFQWSETQKNLCYTLKSFIHLFC